MTATATLSGQAISSPNLEAMRADLEAARAAFHQLLNTLSEADLQKPCLISRWTVKEVMCHLVLGVEQAVPMMVKQARQGKPMPKWMDSRFGNWMNYKMAVWSARKATRASLAQRYDAAHEKLLRLLAGVRDQEWGLPTAYPDGRPLTMETVFHVPSEHFALHAAWVRQTIEATGRQT